MMLRRSLNTFMNAFTSSDSTAYPFATQNRKDFDNLLAVYLDAVFFPTLDPLDFAQEGWRVDFETPDDESQLVFKGVVYNEMKGCNECAIEPIMATTCTIQSFRIRFIDTIVEVSRPTFQISVMNNYELSMRNTTTRATRYS